ncbi:hypothetical protein [Clostridium mediterraneense]|uniref:hypothetical protein n=1 Tax=Clostridium mediterraneense TaxID=1805472 RepID=UPI0008336FB7|nr:hypothetical protein [Clostridium mediterraneense]
MKNRIIETKDYKMRDLKKVEEISRNVDTREKEFFDFFKNIEEVERDKKYLADNKEEKRYLVILNMNEENEKVYDCSTNKDTAFKIYNDMEDEVDRCIVVADIFYKDVMGVTFIEKYKVLECLECYNKVCPIID